MKTQSCKLEYKNTNNSKKLKDIYTVGNFYLAMMCHYLGASDRGGALLGLRAELVCLPLLLLLSHKQAVKHDKNTQYNIKQLTWQYSQSSVPLL